MHSIYMIVNRKSGKVYVGQSQNYARRMRDHFRALLSQTHQCAYLQRAFTKDGPDAFDPFEIDQFSTKQACDEAERFYIAWFRSLRLAYNHMGGGEGNYQPDEATRYKLGSNWRGKAGPFKGKKHSAETIALLSEITKKRIAEQGHPMKGKRLSEEACAKIGAVHKGKKLSPEHRAKVVAALGRRVFTPEYRRKLSEAAKGNQHFLGKHLSEEAKRKLSEDRMGEKNPHYGKPRSEEAKRKTSEALKGRQTHPMTPEMRAKISATKTGRKMGPHSAETCEKMRQAWVRRRLRNQPAGESLTLEL